MQKLYFLLLFALNSLLFTSTYAQDFNVHPEEGGTFPTYDIAIEGKFCSIDGNEYQFATLQSIGSYDEFVIEADAWFNKWTATGLAFNAITSLPWGGGSNMPATNGTFSTNTTVGYYYTYRIQNNAYANTTGIVMETENAPVEFTHVSVIDDRVVGYLSAIPSAGENVYVVYSTGGAFTAVNAAATTGSFDITLPSTPTEVFVITSTASMADVSSNPNLAALRYYGMDTNGQASNADCPKMETFNLVTTIPSICLPEGGAEIVMDGTIDNPGGTILPNGGDGSGFQYHLVNEFDFSAPLKSNDPTSNTRSDFIGESSANIVTYNANTFGYNVYGTDWHNIASEGWGTADIERFYISWDATYLYMAVQGPTAFHAYDGRIDRMDMFIAIDTDSDVVAHPYDTPTATQKLSNTEAPYDKRVDFSGWRPEYFVAVERIGSGDYCSLHASGASVGTAIATDVNAGAEAACPSFEYRSSFGGDRTTEVRVPWTLIGGRPDMSTGKRMNFALYTTFDDDDFDVYDSAPGSGQGHGNPFEQIGDCPWDGDHFGLKLDPVTGANDGTYTYGESLNSDPFTSRVPDQGPGDQVVGTGRQPGSDNAQVNGADNADFDTIEEYFSISNVGQITYNVLSVDYPDDINQNCNVALPASLTAINEDFDDNGFYNATDASIMISDGGECYTPKVNITASDVASMDVYGPDCDPGCSGVPTFYTRTYTVEFIDKILEPVAECASLTIMNETITPSGSQTITMDPVDGAGTCVVLPVELINFNAIHKDDHVLLEWRTASEENASHFEVERSLDGFNYNRLGTVMAVGNSTEIQNYDYIDEDLLLGNHYYRLKIVDLDGTFEYSEIEVISIFKKKDSKTIIYPNPNNGTFTIEMDNESPIQSINIYNSIGQLMYHIDNPETEISLPNISKGLYILEIESEQTISHHNLMIQN